MWGSKGDWSVWRSQSCWWNQRIRFRFEISVLSLIGRNKYLKFWMNCVFCFRCREWMWSIQGWFSKACCWEGTAFEVETQGDCGNAGQSSANLCGDGECHGQNKAWSRKFEKICYTGLDFWPFLNSKKFAIQVLTSWYSLFNFLLSGFSVM